MIKPALTATVFSDYICPFCYIGHLRLERLREDFDLQVDWRFLEIHPDNPPEGRPVAELGYPAHHWETLMQNLARMAEEEGVALPRREFTTNSRRALKLAEAAKEEGPEVFRRLNARLYEAYFLEQRNIGDPGVLAGAISEALITTAAGITVAIPSLLLYRYFRGRVQLLVIGMEQEAMKLVEVMQGEREKDASLEENAA